MAETFGHLAIKKNVAYHGRLVFAVGCYESGYLNPTALLCEFDGVNDSPWLYDGVEEFMQSITDKLEVGCVYEFNGELKNYEFDGKIKLILNPDK
jgi:hypothetical protein